jgi:exopolysaccharide biosynthesis operon protein EpsL
MTWWEGQPETPAAPLDDEKQMDDEERWPMPISGRSHDGVFFRLRGLRAVIILAGIFSPVTDAVALWNDKLELFAAERITYDSNVFRLSSGVDPATVTGSSSKGDSYATTDLGFRFDVPVSRQRFLGDWAWNDNRYNKFTELDYLGHHGRAVWEWQAGNDLSGELGFAESQSLASLANLQNGTQSSTPNPLYRRNSFFNAAYMLTPRWRLKGDLTKSKEENGAPEFQVNDGSINGTGLTVSYITPAANELGVNVRFSDASYAIRQPVAGSLIDNAYRQRNVALVFAWTNGDKSRLRAQLGQVNRSYDELPERDYQATTYHVAYDWKAIGKLTLTAEARRDISETEEVYTGFVFLQGVALRPAFQLTQKMTLSAALEYNKWDYLGDPGLALGTVQPRTDKVRSAVLFLTYRPLQHVSLEASVRRDTRTSTADFGDYETNIISASARIGF